MKKFFEIKNLMGKEGFGLNGKDNRKVILLYFVVSYNQRLVLIYNDTDLISLMLCVGHAISYQIVVERDNH